VGWVNTEKEKRYCNGLQNIIKFKSLYSHERYCQ
jgi:hypothetical protein